MMKASQNFMIANYFAIDCSLMQRMQPGPSEPVLNFDLKSSSVWQYNLNA